MKWWDNEYECHLYLICKINNTINNLYEFILW